MKKVLSLIMVLALCVSCAAAGAEELVNTIAHIPTTQAFTDEAVSDADINAILQAGLAAASAINQQPWYFIALTNKDVMTEIAGSMSFGGAPAGAPTGAPAGAPAMGEGMPAMPAPAAGTSAKAALGDSPLAVIVYMDENTASPNANFDCGLACENMVIAALALGYGTKIVSSPTMALNGDNHDALCEKLGVDKALSAVAVLLIGRADDAVDGVTSASTRNTVEEKVSYIK